MARFSGWCLAVLLSGATAATPAAAQSRGGSTSLTHSVSVTVPSRVKIKVSALALTTSHQRSLALTVNANRSWVIASPDGVLAAGTASSAVDTRLVFRNAPKPRPSKANDPVVLTISAP